jgi:hypothetical protein
MRPLILFSLFLIGCSSSPDETSVHDFLFDKNRCVTPHATYDISYEEQDPGHAGSCGAIMSTAFLVPTDPTLVSGKCIIGSNARFEGCTAFLNTTCYNDNLTFHEAGKVVWLADGSAGHGIITLKANDGITNCFSIYSLTARRL